MRLNLSVYALLALVPALALLDGCGNGEGGGPPAGPPEVGVITLEATAVPLTRTLPGRTAAFRLAEVRPRVSGIIEERLFEEGGEVSAGAPLYRIDAERYRAVSEQARAQLSEARARLANAERIARRYEKLRADGAISRQDYDNALSELDAARAAVASARAAANAAAVDLGYTRVTAPVAGMIGKSSVTEGALVTANQAEPLATVQQIDPIYVELTQSAKDMLMLKRGMERGALEPEQARTRVFLTLEDGSRYRYAGELQFAEVDVNESTGSVLLRAVVPNPDRLLLPGMFVTAEFRVGVRSDAVLVPQQGVTHNRKGQATALVVGDDGEVALRELSLGESVDTQWVVLDGLSASDRVVVEGVQKVQPGMTVKAVAASTAGAYERSVGAIVDSQE